MLKANLPTDVVQLARGAFGPAREVRDVSSPSSTVQTIRWIGTRSQGFVKVYRSMRPFVQERAAYERWTSRLPDVPRLLAATAHPTPTIAISALRGRPAEHLALAPARERVLHEAAGAWLRRLHQLPHVDDDQVPLADAVRLRWSAVWDCAPGTGAEGLARRWVGEILERAAPAIGGTRVPCHRDYQPANWLADEHGDWVGTIDFEHARPDHPFADLARLAAYVWPSRPDLEGAFRAGYGSLGEAEPALRAFAVAEAWHRWRWALRHGDRSLSDSGARALVALGAPVDAGDLAYPAP